MPAREILDINALACACRGLQVDTHSKTCIAANELPVRSRAANLSPAGAIDHTVLGEQGAQDASPARNEFVRDRIILSHENARFRWGVRRQLVWIRPER